MYALSHWNTKDDIRQVTSVFWFRTNWSWMIWIWWPSMSPRGPLLSARSCWSLRYMNSKHDKCMPKTTGPPTTCNNTHKLQICSVLVYVPFHHGKHVKQKPFDATWLMIGVLDMPMWGPWTCHEWCFCWCAHTVPAVKPHGRCGIPVGPVQWPVEWFGQRVLLCLCHWNHGCLGCLGR